MQKIRVWGLAAILLAGFFYASTGFGKTVSSNVMAPLSIGDVKNPNASSEAAEWTEFEKHLEDAKKIGVYAVTTDVWWGVVEAKKGTYVWDYYDKLAKTIRDKKLKWIPILSFHQCGGNVGDECFFPLPKWIWTSHVGETGITSANSLKYKSEYGHYADEVISVWGTKTVLTDYARFFTEFQKHFADYADDIAEINVSLGASGELRYPSFNAHDPKAGYPSRGSLQSYSDLAIASFREAVKKKYKAIDALNKAWGFTLKAWTDVYPPSDLGPPDASSGFFARDEHFDSYGKDFFDWYQDSLLAHGEMVLAKAIAVFNDSHAEFQGIDIGAKIPGVHWRSSSDRLAEVASGMIRTSSADWNDDKKGHGYSSLVGLFKKLGDKPDSPRIQLHYTCLEKDNGEDGDWAKSMAKALVFWVGAEAKRQGVSIKGENALAGPLANDKAWDNILNALEWSSYSGITILRLKQVSEISLARRRYKELISKFGSP